MRTTNLILALVCTLVGYARVPAADLSKIDRQLAKEPAYKKTPRYCLLVFGPQAGFRVWMAKPCMWTVTGTGI